MRPPYCIIFSFYILVVRILLVHTDALLVLGVGIVVVYTRRCPTADHYEYTATYVDDLAIIIKSPQAFINQLEAAPFNFNLKKPGPLNFYLGCVFSHDTTSTLCMDPGKYTDQIEEACVQHFGIKPGQKDRSLLQKGDHPEQDTTPFLDKKDTAKYQSLLGSCQWNISIGSFRCTVIHYVDVKVPHCSQRRPS